MPANIHSSKLSAVAGVSLAMLLSTSAQAALSISTKPTANVNCSAGVCVATAKKAVLNVSDLTTMLAAGSVAVESGSQANDITVDAPFGWTSSNALTLDAYHSIAVRKAIFDAGSGALALTTNDKGSGGTLSFIGKGRISFSSTANSVTINSQAYTLENSLASLVSAITANPSGYYALANDYDAKSEGKYTQTPISEFDGTLEGFGNSISHFSLRDDSPRAYVGLIGINRGTVSDLLLEEIELVEKNTKAVIGGIVAHNLGILSGSRTSGNIVGAGNSWIGGLVGWNDFKTKIVFSSSLTSVIGHKYSVVGGLVGYNNGMIDESYSTGRVYDPFQAGAAFPGYVGGLVGRSDGDSISNSYTTVTTTAEGFAQVGGFVGFEQRSNVTSSYSTGAVAGGDHSEIGGFVSSWDGFGVFANCYWDVDTSGTDDGVNGGNVDGITGLTDDQLKSSLPAGFDRAVWAQSPKINNGYPYLKDNPPAN